MERRAVAGRSNSSSGSRSHSGLGEHSLGTHHRRTVALGSALLIVLAAIGFWIHSETDASGVVTKSAVQPVSPPKAKPGPPSFLQTLEGVNQATGKMLLAPASCHQDGASMAACADPAEYISTATFRTFGDGLAGSPSRRSLYSHYVATITALGFKADKANKGDCSPGTTQGEVSWNHDQKHPKIYPLQSAATLNNEVGAAGRVFCTITADGQLELVWTTNAGNLLATMTGGPHSNAWYWWYYIHHAIDLTGPAPMNM